MRSSWSDGSRSPLFRKGSRLCPARSKRGVVLPGDWVEAGAVPQCRSDPACDPYMSDEHDEAVKALEAVADALRDALRALRSAQVTARGLPTAASLRAHPVTEQRPYVDEALRHLEQSRYAVLFAIFAVALEDGMTISA